MNENQQSQGQQMYNNAFVSESALNLRLGTEEILNKIESFLRGKVAVPEQDASGKITFRMKKCGEPKANDVGVQSIIAKINSMFNPAVVQGNYTQDMYFQHISDLRKEISYDMAINCNTWGVSESDLEGITDLIMSSFKGFLSRLIDNKERESFANTMRTTEVTSLNSQETMYKK